MVPERGVIRSVSCGGVPLFYARCYPPTLVLSTHTPFVCEPSRSGQVPPSSGVSCVWSVCYHTLPQKTSRTEPKGECSTDKKNATRARGPKRD